MLPFTKNLCILHIELLLKHFYILMKIEGSAFSFVAKDYRAQQDFSKTSDTLGKDYGDI